jgi:hypothetical protein
MALILLINLVGQELADSDGRRIPTPERGR